MKLVAARGDAKLKGVIISEKWDKKWQKYTTPSVPFPYKTPEVRQDPTLAHSHSINNAWINDWEQECLRNLKDFWVLRPLPPLHWMPSLQHTRCEHSAQPRTLTVYTYALFLLMFAVNAGLRAMHASINWAGYKHRGCFPGDDKAGSNQTNRSNNRTLTTEHFRGEHCGRETQEARGYNGYPGREVEEEQEKLDANCLLRFGLLV
jgi:hypothetical protein